MLRNEDKSSFEEVDLDSLEEEQVCRWLKGCATDLAGRKVDREGAGKIAKGGI